MSDRNKAISLAILQPGSARHPHVLRVRSGGCTLADDKLAAPITPLYVSYCFFKLWSDSMVSV
ncbi:DNA metabolism protein [Salmonella enterica subsp. houtenae serovar 40:z4,z32:-]|nr:DNA metabolism protein [Salmonella enterica]OSD47079.1 DNA metabolism protein [Salmonella enterica subsp. houtenae serovar 40:z4,z32:-]OSD79423.1 DNA metabolism protein [Salmonella enterica subsp. houtenae serovar 40:z4,z32:-]OSD92008.1 DNA metabolism protein [Salmonella enterica subsp. houtenae serovar 40:z4,z32:-]OSE35589.1 DNA metabolism protein [Salmonella enterica subsp. houtenae serovar 40:z4,z32:-]